MLEDIENTESNEKSYAARLITQGQHKFYMLAMPSEVLAQTCTVDVRVKNPVTGFQRVLDEKRAQDIADYIDSGLGTIPCAIVLSAQDSANLEYKSKNQVLSFNTAPDAFLILDGQHRVYGFAKAKTHLRVPVVIYNGLTRADEAKLFIDINTKQRPVPNELLLDIKRLAENESDTEAFQRDIFDLFHNRDDSPLKGYTSASTRRQGKISRVTFKAALTSIAAFLQEDDAEWNYNVLSAYLNTWTVELAKHGVTENIANATLFRGIMLFFPLVAERVYNRHGPAYTADNFSQALEPVFSKIKTTLLKKPGQSPTKIRDDLEGMMKSAFSIGRQ